MLTAEVIPVSEKDLAALALQRKGFKILSIGDTITIGGEPELFEVVFKMELEKRSKDVLTGIPDKAKIVYFKPITPPSIPDDFKFLIKEVLFPEPPEYF